MPESSPTLPSLTLPEIGTATDTMLETLVAHWHEVEPQHSEEGLAGKVCDLHQFNFLLWHEEDIARSPDVTDTKIAAVKRAIVEKKCSKPSWQAFTPPFISGIAHIWKQHISLRGFPPERQKTTNFKISLYLLAKDLNTHFGKYM